MGEHRKKVQKSITVREKATQKVEYQWVVFTYEDEPSAAFISSHHTANEITKVLGAGYEIRVENV